MQTSFDPQYLPKLSFLRLSYFIKKNLKKLRFKYLTFFKIICKDTLFLIKKYENWKIKYFPQLYVISKKLSVMYVKRLTIIFILVFYACSLIAQGQDSIKKEKLEKHNSFLFAPFNLFDFVNPNFQIGYERFVAKRWSLQIDGAIIINHSIENYLIDWFSGIKVRDCPYTNKGFRVKLSTKYVVLDKRKIKLYVSPELFYYRNKSGIVRDFLVSDPDFEYSFGIAPEGMNGYTQFFYNDEEKFGVNFKVGIKILLGKHFFLEPHFGFGFAYRNVKQSERENPNDKLYDFWDDIDLGFFDKAAPNKWVPTLPFNFKIGFRF